MWKPIPAISTSLALDSVCEAALSCSNAGSGATSTSRLAPQSRAVRAAVTTPVSATRIIGVAFGTNVSSPVMQM